MMLTASPLSWEHQNRHLWVGTTSFRSMTMSTCNTETTGRAECRALFGI